MNFPSFLQKEQKTEKNREIYTNIRSYEILPDLIPTPLYEVNVS